MEAIAGSNKTKSRTRHIFNAQVFLDSAGVARKIVEFPTKATIFAQGDPARAVKYIQQGGVKLTVINGSGKEAVVAIFNAAPDVPILILGNGNEALARKAVERGAKDYLPGRVTSIAIRCRALCETPSNARPSRMITSGWLPAASNHGLTKCSDWTSSDVAHTGSRRIPRHRRSASIRLLPNPSFVRRTKSPAGAREVIAGPRRRAESTRVDCQGCFAQGSAGRADHGHRTTGSPLFLHDSASRR